MRKGPPSRSRRNLKDTPFLVKARARYKLANDADAEQDQRERDDIRFEDGDQWPTTLKIARQGQQPVNGMPAVPARPTLVIDKVKEPVRQILNQERQADLGIQIAPADDFGDLGLTPDDTEITLREGLVRRIQRTSHAADARTWAFKRSVIAGRGYYIVRARFLPGGTWDQEIYVDRIYNQASVKLDPAHQAPDGSDAEWGFVGTWMSWDTFLDEYPNDADGKDNPFADYAESDFMGLTEAYPGWYKAKGDGERAVRIVDYWYTERTPRTYALLPDGTGAWLDELPKKQQASVVDTRVVSEKQIKFCKIAGGVLELERTDESGPDLPIVKVLGDEVLPYDEQRRVNGVIRPARDAQMGLNYMISKQVEVLGLSPIPTAQLDPNAIEGFESWYALMNTRALPYRPYRSFDDQGRQLNPPTYNSGNPDIYPIAQSVAMFDQAIKSTTAVPDSTLGNVDPSLKSGKAINAVVQNAQLSTSNFLDNLARSVQYEGQIINNKLYAIYASRPGRLVRVLTGEGDEQTFAIGDPADAQLQAKAQKVAKLTKDAHFNVIVKVTKAYESRRTQEYTELGQLISAEPTMMGWFGDLYFKNSDMPGRQQLAERAKVMLVPPIQQMIAQEAQGGTPNPQMQQAQGQIQQLQQQLQQAQAQIESDMAAKQLESQTRWGIAQLESQTRKEIAQMEIEADLAKTQATLNQKQAEAMVENQTKRIDSALMDKGSIDERSRDAHAQGLDHAHERTQTLIQHAHEKTQAAAAALQQSQLAATQGNKPV